MLATLDAPVAVCAPAPRALPVDKSRREIRGQSLYQRLRDAGLLHGTIRRATILRNQRDKNQPAPRVIAPPSRFDRQNAAKRARAAVNLGRESQLELFAWARSVRPRVQRWTSATASKFTAGRTICETDQGRYSSRCTFRKIDYSPVVGSYALVCQSGRMLRYVYDAQVYRLRAPRGWQWSKDANGIRLVSLANPRMDFHPDSDDLRAYDWRKLTAQARSLYAMRRGQAAQAKREERERAANAERDAELTRRAEALGVLVCFADSIRAGNCRAGTEGFVQRAGLDARGHYSPAQLLAVAGSSSRLVAIACAAALRRAKQEIERGYSLLAEHGR
jgi:hypothetical protein